MSGWERPCARRNLRRRARRGHDQALLIDVSTCGQVDTGSWRPTAQKSHLGLRNPTKRRPTRTDVPTQRLVQVERPTSRGLEETLTSTQNSMVSPTSGKHRKSELGSGTRALELGDS